MVSMRRSMAGAVMLAALGILILAAPVGAFPLTNCTLQATSLDANGATIDSIQSGADDATQADPFIVDWDGSVDYDGTAQIAMVNNSWHIDVFGIPTPLRGGDDNPADDHVGSGTVEVSANAPFRFTGLYFVSGSITGSGGTCVGSGWFKLAGDPIGTIPWIIALIVLLLGLLMLALGARGHPIIAFVGGLFTGLGLATLLVLYSTLPLGSGTPIIVLLLGLILGVVIAYLGRRGGDGSKTAPMLPPTNPTTPATPTPPSSGGSTTA
jgi:hypothetical protein